MAVQDDQPCSSSMSNVCLEERDIEGPVLDEPLEKTILQLHWWLTFYGDEPASNERELHRYQGIAYSYSGKLSIVCVFFSYRVRKLKSQGAGFVGIDGTYLKRKCQKCLSQQCSVAPLPCPGFPTVGWRMIDLHQPQAFLAEMPCISQSTLYTYLAEGVGNVKGISCTETRV